MKKAIFSVFVFLFLALPFAIAEENTTVTQESKEYPLLERAMDRIKLAFTAQIERRMALMDKIQQRREAHYQFLIGKGKTDQAERFKASTVGLVKNFDEWRARKQQKLSDVEQQAQDKFQEKQRLRNMSS